MSSEAAVGEQRLPKESAVDWEAIFDEYGPCINGGKLPLVLSFQEGVEDEAHARDLIQNAIENETIDGTSHENGYVLAGYEPESEPEDEPVADEIGDDDASASEHDLGDLTQTVEKLKVAEVERQARDLANGAVLSRDAAFIEELDHLGIEFEVGPNIVRNPNVDMENSTALAELEDAIPIERDRILVKLGYKDADDFDRIDEYRAVLVWEEFLTFADSAARGNLVLSSAGVKKRLTQVLGTEPHSEIVKRVMQNVERRSNELVAVKKPEKDLQLVGPEAAVEKAFVRLYESRTTADNHSVVIGK